MSRRHFVAVGHLNKRIGIVSSSYKSFLRKCRKKFNIKEKDIYITLDDDTEVDEEYFEVLQNGIDLHVKSRKETKSPDSLNQLASFLHKCLLKQPNIHDKVAECLQKPDQASAVFQLLAQIAESSCTPSKRDEDLRWFKGLDTKFKTKEAVMRNSAGTRMRGYLEQAKKWLLTDDLLAESPCRRAIKFFKEELAKCNYNADYFDRLAQSGARFCDESGLFECEGPYNKASCGDVHTINPYNSREARIVFSTWNLDHVVEKSRSILPLLKSALEGPKSSAVNLPYFHSLLFLRQCRNGQTVTGNLKLVHIACHDKKLHEVTCNTSEVYLKKGKVIGSSNIPSDRSHDVTDSLQLQPPNGMITRQKTRGIDGMNCHSDEVDGVLLQPQLWVGVTTRQRKKRTNPEVYTEKQKRLRLDTRRVWKSTDQCI